MDLLIILIEYDSCIIMMKTMSVAKRIFGVISCLLVYVGTVALDLYNAARYKEEAYLNGGHLYTNWYSVYDIPEVHCIDGYDIFSACFWPMLLILPLLLYFAVRRETLSKWYKILIIMSTIWFSVASSMTCGYYLRLLSLNSIGMEGSHYTCYILWKSLCSRSCMS